MKVLHINRTDWGGGAAIACHRLNDALNEAGIDSSMLVLFKKTNDPKVHEHTIGKIRKFWLKALDKSFLTIFDFYASWSLNSIGYDFSEDKHVEEADIIFIHWINTYCLSLKSIEKILKKGKPVYWFMHDMWPITGGCHHALNCTKYKEHCQRCPMSHKGKGSLKNKDLSYMQFNEKLKRLVKYPNLKFITPSKWLADRVKESKLFYKHEVSVKRNLVDTRLFCQQDKKKSRRDLGLPENKKLILFGADNINSPYKGWSLLKDTLNMGFDNIECVIYGKVNESDLRDINIKIHNLGLIINQESLVKLYSACDIFVTSSLADNYPNVLIEAMACGLVCVGYNVGGIPEIIHHKKTGLIADNISSESLHESIVNVLDDFRLTEYSNNAKLQIDNENSYKNVLSIYDMVK